MADLRKLLNELDREVQSKHSELKALDQKIYAAQLNLKELNERVGDSMKNLEVKKRLEEIQAAARKFAEEP
jgi:hypothetical protein